MLRDIGRKAAFCALVIHPIEFHHHLHVQNYISLVPLISWALFLLSFI